MVVTLKGKVAWMDMSGGTWIFVADDGRQFQLDAHDQRLLKNGLRATVSGEIASDTMSIGMMGETLRVSSFTPD